MFSCCSSFCYLSIFNSFIDFDQLSQGHSRHDPASCQWQKRGTIYRGAEGSPVFVPLTLGELHGVQGTSRGQRLIIAGEVLLSLHLCKGNIEHSCQILSREVCSQLPLQPHRKVGSLLTMQILLHFLSLDEGFSSKLESH